MTKKYENDKIYRAMVDAITYNIGFEFFKDFYDCFSLLKDGDHISTCSENACDDAWYDNDAANQYWSMFVLMYGDYGTSPRSGWIIKTKESTDFFEELYNDLKELE